MRRGPTALLVVLGALAAAPSAAATINVNTTKDELISSDGTCSLREAVLAANGTPEADCPGAATSGVTTITVPAGTYHLSLGSELQLSGPMSLHGAGASRTTIDADGHDRAVLVEGSQESISSLTITGGRTRDGDDGQNPGQSGGPGGAGGGIENQGTLALMSSVITGNATGSGGGGAAGTGCGAGGSGGGGGGGGGIWNAGTLSLAAVTVSSNNTGDGGAGGAGCAPGEGGEGGEGGGVLNGGSLSVTSSTIEGDRTGNGGAGGGGVSGAGGGVGGAGGPGGAIANDGGTLAISTSTVNGNHSGPGGFGGAGSGNAAGGPGGGGGDGAGLWSTASGTVTLGNSTLTLNSAGDGGYGGPGGGSGGAGGLGGTGGSGALSLVQGSASVSSATVAGNLAGVGGTPGLAGSGGGSAGPPGGAGAAGGIDVSPSASLVEQNTIVASNPLANCAGAITDAGDDLSFPDLSCPHESSGDPRLGPLGNYGGPTQTVSLGVGSAAIDGVPAGKGCLPTDQRSVPRPQGSACDIGAYERAALVCRSVAASTHGTHPVAVQLSCGDPAHLAPRYAIVRGPAHGKLGSLNANGGQVTYTAKAGFAGTDHFTYRATTANGAAVPRSATVHVAPVPLVISNAELSRKRLRVGQGTKFMLTLSLAAKVKVMITHRRHGRTVTVAALSAQEKAGQHTITFRGRVGDQALTPDSYTATLVASVGARRSKPVTLNFVVTR